MELSDDPNASPAEGVKASTTPSTFNVHGPLDEAAKTPYRQRGESEYEWTLGELLPAHPGMPFHIESYKLSAELYYRLVKLMFILLLPIIAALVIIEPRRNPEPIRFMLGVVVVLGFYQYLSYATSVSRNNPASPLISLWLPLAVVYVVAMLKFWILAYRPAFVSAG